MGRALRRREKDGRQRGKSCYAEVDRGPEPGEKRLEEARFGSQLELFELDLDEIVGNYRGWCAGI